MCIKISIIAFRGAQNPGIDGYDGAKYLWAPTMILTAYQHCDT